MVLDVLMQADVALRVECPQEVNRYHLEPVSNANVAYQHYVERTCLRVTKEARSATRTALGCESGSALRNSNVVHYEGAHDGNIR